MKSNCCQEKMDVAGKTTKYYTCMKCEKPCDPWQCIRCDKLLDEYVHTCTPTKQYRAGIIEGMKLAHDKVDDSYDSNRMSLFNSYGYHEEVLSMISELIEQYENKE